MRKYTKTIALFIKGLKQLLLCFLSLIVLLSLTVTSYMHASFDAGTMLGEKSIEENKAISIVPIKEETIEIATINERKPIVQIKEEKIKVTKIQEKITPIIGKRVRIQEKKAAIIKKSISIESSEIPIVAQKEQKIINEVSNKPLIISNEVQIVARNLISDEVVIKEVESENEDLELSSASLIEPLTQVTLDFISIGQGTLIKGKATSESTIVITTDLGTECRAQVNGSGKFGCMFAREIVSKDDITITYEGIDLHSKENGRSVIFSEE